MKRMNDGVDRRVHDSDACNPHRSTYAAAVGAVELADSTVVAVPLYLENVVVVVVDEAAVRPILPRFHRRYRK